MDKSYRTKYAERLNRQHQFGAKTSASTSGVDADAESPFEAKAKPSSKYFNSEYSQRKDKEEYENLARLLKESHERSMKNLHARFSSYMDHYVGLLQLKYKLHKLRSEQEQMGFLFDMDFDSDEEDSDSSDDNDDMLLRNTFLYGHRFGQPPPKKPTSKPRASSKSTKASSQKKPTRKKSRTEFKLYNKYEDHESELALENGLFTIQIDVGGSKDHEILIDSEENHLTVKSKDSAGHQHTFGIICPKVDDIDKLNIHHPKDGLLVIQGPSKGKSQTEIKKARTVHM